MYYEVVGLIKIKRNEECNMGITIWNLESTAQNWEFFKQRSRTTAVSDCIKYLLLPHLIVLRCQSRSENGLNFTAKTGYLMRQPTWLSVLACSVRSDIPSKCLKPYYYYMILCEPMATRWPVCDQTTRKGELFTQKLSRPHCHQCYSFYPLGVKGCH